MADPAGQILLALSPSLWAKFHYFHAILDAKSVFAHILKYLDPPLQTIAKSEIGYFHRYLGLEVKSLKEIVSREGVFSVIYNLEKWTKIMS